MENIPSKYHREAKEDSDFINKCINIFILGLFATIILIFYICITCLSDATL